MRISFLAFFLLPLLAVGVCAGDAYGGRAARKIRLVSLQTLLSSKQALAHIKWRALKETDSVLQDVMAADDALLSQNRRWTANDTRALLKDAQQRAELSAKRQRILSELNDLYAESDALRNEIKKLRSEMRLNRQVMEGHWTLTLMPGDTTGDVYFTQNGTLVQGDYHLTNGQAGSFRGTLINRILVVERIDQRYGKMGRLQGTVSKGDREVHGSWYSYNLGSGKAITGPFSLVLAQEGGAQ